MLTGPGGRPLSTRPGAAISASSTSREAWGAALPYADRNVPWHEPAAAAAITHCEERLRQLHPYAMAHYDRLRAKASAQRGDARSRATVRPPSPAPGRVRCSAPHAAAAPQPGIGPASGPAPDSLAGYVRPGRSMRPCDEDFPWSIREVLAAEAGRGETGRAAAVPAVA